MKKSLVAIPSVLLTMLSLGGCPAMSIVTASGSQEKSPAESAGVVATPAISTSIDVGGMCEALTISCATEGAVISYSLDDGSSWLPYDAPVIVYQASSILAGATADGYVDSKIALADGFRPRALVVPFIFIKGQVANIRPSTGIIYSTGNYWAPGTWKVYAGPIDLSKVKTLAVKCGLDGEGHPNPAPVTLPNGVKVTFMPVIVPLAEDWSTYETDLWVEFSDPVTGSATQNGEACILEQPEAGNACLYEIGRAHV
jgi:hypothetical protein